jgi:hypothetical protein
MAFQRRLCKYFDRHSFPGVLGNLNPCLRKIIAQSFHHWASALVARAVLIWQLDLDVIAAHRLTFTAIL